MGPVPVRESPARRSLIRRVLRWAGRLTLLALLALALTTWLAPGWVLPPVARFLNVSEPPRAADCVLVLNGDPNTRPFAAAALVKAGLAREVLLTTQRRTIESGGVQDGVRLSELDVIRRVLRARGVPDEAVRVLPADVASTFDEARALGEFLDEHSATTVAVVTNGFHTRRARWIFRRVLGANASRVYFVGVPRDRVDEGSWWRSEEGWTIYPSEYAKFLYYRVRY